MEPSFPEPYTAMTRERGRMEPRETKADSGGTEDKRREHDNCLEPPIENQRSQ